MFTLRFDPKALEFWASRFPDSPATLRIMNEIAPRTRARGAMSKADFLTICEWNSARPRKRGDSRRCNIRRADSCRT